MYPILSYNLHSDSLSKTSTNFCDRLKMKAQYTDTKRLNIYELWAPLA